jgi:hypothetical protein
MSSQIFSTFSVVLLMLGHPVCSSSLTDIWSALKSECYSKTAVWLKECSPKLDEDMLHDFAIHCRQNETWRWKSTHVKTMHVHSTVSHNRLTQLASGSVTVAPLPSSFNEAVTTITVEELSDSTSYCYKFSHMFSRDSSHGILITYTCCYLNVLWKEILSIHLAEGKQEIRPQSLLAGQVRTWC